MSMASQGQLREQQGMAWKGGKREDRQGYSVLEAIVRSEYEVGREVFVFKGTGGSEILAPQQVEIALAYALEEKNM